MVGGSKAYLDAVLKYDPDQDNWEKLEVTLSRPRTEATAFLFDSSMIPGCNSTTN